MFVIRALAFILSILWVPLTLAVAATALAIEDLCFFLFGKVTQPENVPAATATVSVVIPTWNGLDLLRNYLPSVVEALRAKPESEILVVDNASEDGTAEFLEQHFPEVTVLRQHENRGFGGGSNAGFRAAKNDIVVLLNNDMQVERDFLAPLLEPFSDPAVFAVSCQIFLADPKQLREETGLTETAWQRGRMAVTHRTDDAVDEVFPCAYAGGGSSAFDRRKFLELGGFDELYRPFYWEDTDVGLMAWKRGWKVFYQPRSVVIHRHRGTIGRKFDRDYIDSVGERNHLLFVWKNIHHWGMLRQSFLQIAVRGTLGYLINYPKAHRTARAALYAVTHVRELMKARWRAHELAPINDVEALRREQADYFRDRFEVPDAIPDRLQVLFVSPYPIEPPVHGGAVSMRETIRALSIRADVHLLSFLDNAEEIPAQKPLAPFCASTTFLVRKPVLGRNAFSLTPRVIEEFEDGDFGWALRRIVRTRKIDVVQIEYTMLAQYSKEYKRIPCFLFEHDVSFQSLARRLKTQFSFRNAIAYMQVLRFETRAVANFARVQVCTEENKRYLLEFVPGLEGRVDTGVRAGIDLSTYRFVNKDRDSNNALFVGSFNHAPNVQALIWFLDNVWPVVLAGNPEARLTVAGAGRIDAVGERLRQPSVSCLGYVPDVRVLYERCSLMICPILIGSGVRMKLLEAFASGIPVVSTMVGAEGLTQRSGEVCELADSPPAFAGSVLQLFAHPDTAASLAVRARNLVERDWDSHASTAKLLDTYFKEVSARRSGVPGRGKRPEDAGTRVIPTASV